MSRKKDSSNIQKFSLPNTDAFKKIDSTNIYDKEVYVLLEKGQNLIRVNKLNEAYEIGKKLLTNYRNNYDVIMYVADIFLIFIKKNKFKDTKDIFFLLLPILMVFFWFCIIY